MQQQIEWALEGRQLDAKLARSRVVLVYGWTDSLHVDCGAIAQLGGCYQPCIEVSF
jgi:hypothetical protein